MTERTDDRARDFSRYLEDTGGEAGLPDGTPLHFIPRDDEAAVSRVLKLHGIREFRTDYVATTTWQTMPHRLPRGVPWTEFPILLDPSHAPRRSHLCMVHWTPTGSTMPPGIALGTAIEQVRVVFLHLDPKWTRVQEADHLLQLLDLLDRTPGVERILRFGDDGVRELSRESLRRDCAWRAPSRRFDYNYRINFQAIAGKALLEALRSTRSEIDVVYVPPTPSAAQRIATRISQIEAGHYRGLDDPMLLQFLYRLRRQGPLPMSADEGPALLRSKDGEFWWRGTGVRPPALLDRMDVLGIFTMPGAREVVIGWEQGAFHLLPAGERFLELIHPDMEDPDLLCRWADRPLLEADIQGMDAWIMSKFRKTKTRVNRIGASAT